MFQNPPGLGVVLPQPAILPLCRLALPHRDETAFPGQAVSRIVLTRSVPTSPFLKPNEPPRTSVPIPLSRFQAALLRPSLARKTLRRARLPSSTLPSKSRASQDGKVLGKEILDESAERHALSASGVARCRSRARVPEQGFLG